MDVLRDFAAKYGITYTLFSDEGSRVIRALGLFNDQVYEHHAAYGIAKQDRVWGVPYPACSCSTPTETWSRSAFSRAIANARLV